MIKMEIVSDREEMIFRNDRLITMYKILSDYLNEQDNMVFLPMENMYERENIFSKKLEKRRPIPICSSALRST